MKFFGGSAVCAYVVETLVFSDGERFPVLKDCETGAPMFEPTCYVVDMVRQRNRAANTIDQAFRSIMIFVLFVGHRGIDIKERLREGELLRLNELSELAAWCRLPLDAIKAQVAGEGGGNSKAPSRRLFSRKARQMPVSADQIHQRSAAIRICYIRDYLDWLVTRHLSQHRIDSSTRHALEAAQKLVVDGLNARTPSFRGRNVLGRREGLSLEMEIRLRQAIHPNSPENPWKHPFVRHRNYVLILWYLALGIRRGEALGVKIADDLDFQSQNVLIRRRADDPEDPRRQQPNAKTLDRALTLEDELASATLRYVLDYRELKHKALEHDFLFVAEGGDPMTLVAVNKVFEQLREKCSWLPKRFGPHHCRHTKNERLSEAWGDNPPPDAEKIRAELMGWVPWSRMGEVYTRLNRRKKGEEASLKLQNKMWEAASGE